MSQRLLSRRLARLDWPGIEAQLHDRGYARIRRVLTPGECLSIVRLYGDDRRFRKRVNMEPLRFGRGDYAYFREPLPPLVRQLRTHGYRHLAAIANRWNETLGRPERYPRSLAAFRRQTASVGQFRSTPLLLRYGAEGFNCLHRDLYGEIAFPFQLTIFLSRPGVDFEGGEFLLVENWPRAQSRGEALLPDQGDMLVFPVRDRPVTGRRGRFRVDVRHGVSRLRRGERHALGIIFHDAR